MKRKGFTLIELLAVIIILAIIALIAMPRIIELVDKAKESSFERQKEFILDAAKMYTFKNPNVKELGYVTLRELIDNNYIESGIKDNKGNVLDDIYIVNLESNHVVTTTKTEGEVININNSIGLPLNKLIISGKSDQTIPSGYTFYDYISLSGAQYIDSGVIPNNNTSVFVDCKPTVSGRWIFGSRITSASSTDRLGLYVNTNANMFPQYNAQGISTINITNTLLRTRHKLSKNEYWVNGTKLHTFTEKNFNGTNTVYIGAMNQTSVDARIFSGDIYQAKIWQGNTLIRNYIPSVRTSDNVVGLYDLVNGVFYTNKGTGNFVRGNLITIHNPDNPYEINNVDNFNLISTDGENESSYNFPYVLRSLNNGVKDYIEID
ncbi:MAG: prepilin-type N-terminal cleavage/methylation domain-containing protein, partial [Bacilli bacterium]|nr:prepilin-type N-terminal cleavage/methylation domain-containing protein [Bacilli bacterium]